MDIEKLIKVTFGAAYEVKISLRVGAQFCVLLQYKNVKDILDASESFNLI